MALNLHSRCDLIIEQLKADLIEARKERDYFKGRADRLELMVMPIPRPNLIDKRTRPISNTPIDMRPKTEWERTLESHIKVEADAQKTEAQRGRAGAIDTEVDRNKSIDEPSKATG